VWSNARGTTRPGSGRSPGDHRAVAAALKARIETLEAELARLEVAAAGHRADFERERERCDQLMAEMLKRTTDLMAAREAAPRLAGEVAAFKARPWWRRLAGLRKFSQTAGTIAAPASPSVS
jgi:hypothetical protein